MLYQSRILSTSSSFRTSDFDRRLIMGIFSLNCTSDASVMADTNPLALLYRVGSERYAIIDLCLPRALMTTFEDSLKAKSSN